MGTLFCCMEWFNEFYCGAYNHEGSECVNEVNEINDIALDDCRVKVCEYGKYLR